MKQYSAQEDYVLNTVNNRDVHFLRFWFADVLGNLKSFAIVPNELERAFDIGMPLDGNCIAGFESTTESDVIAWPEASSFQILPWRPNENCVARMFCNIKTPEGVPFTSDTRHILKEVLRKASKMGYIVNVKPEIEYFYFQSKDRPIPLDDGSTFDLTSLDSATDLRRDTVLTLESIGIPVQQSQHEAGPSQNQIDLRTQDALSMADSIMTYKLAVKEIALKHGVYASFMPKPRNDQPGSSMHLHIHLSNENGDNTFFAENSGDKYCLSTTAKQFTAGILKYMKEFCLVTNQYQNSYKRIISDACLPDRIAWSRNNRSTVIRVPGHRPNTEDCSRIELRNPDPACNPYLALAAIISAGLAGIEEGLQLEEPIEDSKKTKLESDTLPYTLGQSIDCFEQSELMRKTLGDSVFDYLLKVKKAEWHKAISMVDEYELENYLAVL